MEGAPGKRILLHFMTDLREVPNVVGSLSRAGVIISVLSVLTKSAAQAKVEHVIE